MLELRLCLININNKHRRAAIADICSRFGRFFLKNKGRKSFFFPCSSPHCSGEHCGQLQTAGSASWLGKELRVGVKAQAELLSTVRLSAYSGSYFCPSKACL